VFEVVTGTAGRADLVLRVGETAVRVEVIVGVPPAGLLAPVYALPPAAVVMPPGSAGLLYLDLERSREILVPLRSPAKAVLEGEVPVEAESLDPSLATVTPSALTLSAGESAALFRIDTADVDGEALIVFRVGGEERVLRVIVGLPAAGKEPVIFAPPVGVEVEAAP
jgi:hypothetical protein